MKRLLSIAIIAGLLATVFSCERADEPEGPQLLDLYADFEFTEYFEISRKEVDFTNQSVVFTAAFNKLASWELTITGLESNAQKVISQSSRAMDASNAIWDGSTTKLPMFRDEKCLVDLHILDNSTHIYDTIEITATKINEGFVVADFESGNINPKWPDPLIQPGADMSFNVSQDTIAAEGQYYYDLGGAVSWDFLIGLLYIDADAYGLDAFPLSSNAEEVYFNFMLWVPDEITNAIILFRFSEDENGDGSFNGAEEDQYAYELQDFESGWQHISVKYSDLTNLVNGEPADPNGNTLHEPDKLLEMELLFLADPQTGYSQAFLDYMIFTEGEPLNP